MEFHPNPNQPPQQKRINSSFNLKLCAILNESHHSVTSICLLDEQHLASCSYENKIKIHNLLTCRTEQILTGHEDGVLHVSKFKKNSFFSASLDFTIKLWEKQEDYYYCTQTLTGHENSVNKVIPLENSKIASCSSDRTIKIWNGASPFENLVTLKGHADRVSSMIELRQKNVIVSGSDDNEIRFWDSLSYGCRKILKNIPCFSFDSLKEGDDIKIISGGFCEINIIGYSMMQVEATIRSKLWRDVTCISNKEEEGMIFGTSEGKIFFLEKNELGTKMLESNAHELAVNWILVVQGKVFSCSQDTTIKVWGIDEE